MKVSYRRDPEHSSMIMEDLLIDQNRYEIPMLQYNSIPHFLRMQVGSMDGRDRLIYDITGKQSLSVVCRKRKMGEKELEKLFQGILEACTAAEKYMLRTDRFLLDPEYIYADRNTGEISLCYLPAVEAETAEEILTELQELKTGREGTKNEDSAEAVSEPAQEPVYGRALAEFVLKYLDHSDRAAVALGYGFYQGLAVRGEGPATVLKTLLPEVRTEQKKPAAVREESRYEERIEEKIFAGETVSTAAAREERVYPGEKEKASPVKTAADKKKKEIRICVLAVLLAGVGDGLAIWLLRFDMTQAGGLLFLTLAILWLVYLRTYGARKEREDPWEGFYPETEEEEDDRYLDRIFSGIEEENGRDEKEMGKGTGKETGKEMGEETGKEMGEEPDDEVTRILAGPQPGGVFLASEVPGLQMLPVPEGISMIGSSSRQADLRIDSNAVSRVHAQIERDADRCVLTDLNSRNGTFVGGKRLEPNQRIVLNNGDRVQFADAVFQMHINPRISENPL